MKTVILRKQFSSRKTCTGVLAAMQQIGQNNVSVARCNQDIGQTDILIRFGCVGNYGSNFEINTSEMIRLASDKIAARRKLIEHGVSVPKTFFSREDAALHATIGQYPLIGRKRQHQEGREMVICRNIDELRADRQSEYWSEFIQKDREFRVYTFFGRILAISEKIPEFPERVAWNKSLGNGSFKSLKTSEMPRSVGFLALQAINALKIDFSAVDIISKGDQSYVLELNNAPQLSPYRQLLFARAFNWVIKRIEQNGEKPEHFRMPINAQDKLVLLCRDC